MHMLIFHTHNPDINWIRAVLLMHGEFIEHNNRKLHDYLTGLLIATCNSSYKKQNNSLSVAIKEFNVFKAGFP